jgi:hypothetical protein
MIHFNQNAGRLIRQRSWIIESIAIHDNPVTCNEPADSFCFSGPGVQKHGSINLHNEVLAGIVLVRDNALHSRNSLKVNARGPKLASLMNTTAAKRIE